MKFENSNGQVLQFYVHYICAKYHNFRSHTFKEETFGSYFFFDWPLEGHLTGNHRNALSKMFLESSIVACINFSNMPLKEATL